MWKKAVIGAAVFMIAGSIIVYAQQGPEAPIVSVEKSAFTIRVWQHYMRGSSSTRRTWRRLPMRALRRCMQASNLTPIRKRPGQPSSRHYAITTRCGWIGLPIARDLQPPSDPVQRLQRRADALTVRGAALKRLADTLAPIYQSFDDGQKRRFTILARFMRPHPRHFGLGARQYG